MLRGGLRIIRRVFGRVFCYTEIDDYTDHLRGSGAIDMLRGDSDVIPAFYDIYFDHLLARIFDVIRRSLRWVACGFMGR
ncbi:MAG: hypothetical protein ACLU4J_20980 [Butyricimonas paravirosa]